MMQQLTVRWFALVLCFIPLVGRALAARPTRVAQRQWEYEDGFFKPAPCWREETDTDEYSFVETGRNAVFVELFDVSRNYTIRLYDDKMLIRGGNERVRSIFPKFTRITDGSWDALPARSKWVHRHGVIQMDGNGWFRQDSKGLTAFSERGHRTDFVELYDSARDDVIRLSAVAMLRPVKSDAEPSRPTSFAKVRKGHWSPVRDPAQITVTVDLREAPGMAEVAESAKTLCEQWYPIISERLNPNDPPSPRRITMVFKNEMEGVGFTDLDSGRVTINATWLKANPRYIGMVVHETTHVVQHYNLRRSAKAGWLVEGIADYMGYFEYEPETPVRLDSNKTFRDGYAPAACFLNWLERKYDARLIVKLHAHLRADTYSDDLFREFTGHTLDELWAEFRDRKE
jgi:hypothetical protein